MPNLEPQYSDELLWRIDVLIFLQLEERFPSMGEKIGKLAEAGLSASQISQIVGKPSNYVTATLSQRRKNKRKGKK